MDFVLFFLLISTIVLLFAVIVRFFAELSLPKESVLTAEV